MIIFAPLFVIVGIGFFCWLLFTFAVLALPFFVGLTICLWAFHSGAGPLGGVAAGLAAGGSTFGLGQFAHAHVTSRRLRLLIILIYVAPAAIAGYSATYGIAQLAVPSSVWRFLCAIVGAVAVSLTSFVRLSGKTEAGSEGARLARV